MKLTVTIKEEDQMIRITILKQEIVDEGKNFKSSSMKQSQQLLSIPKDAVPGTVIAKYSHGILTLSIDQSLNLRQNNKLITI
jgi:HSP20 family molecular chaperone IbpA